MSMAEWINFGEWISGVLFAAVFGAIWYVRREAMLRHDKLCLHVQTEDAKLARADEKLAQRIEKMASETREANESLEAKVDTRLDRLDTKIDGLADKIERFILALFSPPPKNML